MNTPRQIFEVHVGGEAIGSASGKAMYKFFNSAKDEVGANSVGIVFSNMHEVYREARNRRGKPA